MSQQAYSPAVDAPPHQHPAVALLARETRLRQGPVPRELDGHPVRDGTHWLSGDAFLLRAPAGVGLLYRRGEGITLEHAPDADLRDVDLWLNGTLYAAVAAMNGLLPLHASAVAHEGRVYAFTGPPGAGKSTLCAALGHCGMPLFCDDTLIVDLGEPGSLIGLPGHKRLKLWPEGLKLAGAGPLEQVASDYPKHFAEPAGGHAAGALPIAELVFLEAGEAPALLPVSAGERIARLQDDHYTARLFEWANDLSRSARFAQLARIAARLPMRRFVRPFVAERFDEGVAFLAESIRSGARP